MQDAGQAMSNPDKRVLELLGEPTVQAISERVESLEWLASLAQSVNPFDQDGGLDVDLGFLTTEQAEQIRNFNADRWRGYIAPMTGGLDAFRVNRLNRLILKHVLDIGEELKSAVQPAISQIDEVDEALKVRTETLDPQAIASLWEVLRDACTHLPSKPTEAVVENLYLAILENEKHFNGLLHTRSRNRLQRNIAKSNDAVNAQARTLAHGLFEEAKESRREVQRMRRLGSSCHQRLVVLVKAKRVREATQLLDVLDASTQRMPRTAQPVGDELGAALAAGQYLATKAELIHSLLQDLNPGLLAHSDVQAKIRQIQALGHPPISEPRHAAADNAVSPVVNVNVTEARDVLRGGRRLKPAKGQTEREVQEKADALRALKGAEGERALEPEESGIIMSIVTGKFGSFVQVLKQLREIDDTKLTTVPLERRTVIQQLKRFDLSAALTNIANQLDDPSIRTQFINILGFEGLNEVRQNVVKALKQSPTTDSPGARVMTAKALL